MSLEETLMPVNPTNQTTSPVPGVIRVAKHDTLHQKAAATPRTAADRAANPASTVLVDDRNAISPPLADPIANATATPMPPTVIDMTVPHEEAPEKIIGEPMPDPRTISGDEQNRIEVLTGKRIHRQIGDEQPVGSQPARKQVTSLPSHKR
jgi:hypothetical protein